MKKNKTANAVSFLCTVLLISSLFFTKTVLAADSNELRQAISAIQVDLKTVSSFEFVNLSKLHIKFFGDSGDHIDRFVRDRIKSTVWKGDAPEGVVAYGSKDGRLILTQNYLHTSMPQIARVQFLFHEARHMEGDGWTHIYCPTPYAFRLKGRSFPIPELDDHAEFSKSPVTACDNTSLSAYGVGYTFFESIRNSCTNCTEKVRMDASLYAVLDGINRIADPDAALELLNGANTDPDNAWSVITSVLPQLSSNK